MRIYSDVHSAVTVTLSDGRAVLVEFDSDGADVSPEVGKILLHLGSLSSRYNEYYVKDKVVNAMMDDDLSCPVEGCARKKPFSSRANRDRHIEAKHPEVWAEMQSEG